MRPRAPVPLRRRASLALPLLLPVAAIGALGPRYGGEISVGVLDLPAFGSPSVPRGAGERLLAALVHETLVGIGEEGLPAPGLARRWSAAAGGREWTLRLAEELRFHDERPVASADAARSLRRFLRSPSSAAAVLAEGLEGGRAFRARTTEDLPGLAAPDAQRLVLRFAEPLPLPLAPLAAPAAAVTGPEGAGSGPFVPALQLPERRVALTAFPSHVRGRPYLDRIVVLGIAERSALRAELNAGRIDVAPGESGVSAPVSVLLLVLDPSRPPFDRAEARAAVAAVVDRGDIVRHLVPGGDPAPTLLAPSILPPLGIESAAAPGRLAGEVRLRVSREVPPLVSQRIVAYLSTLGLRVTAEPASPSAVLAVPGQALLLLWSPEVPEAALALRELTALAPSVPAVEEALAAASREPDLDRRRVHLYRAEAQLRAQNVLMPAAVFPVSFGLRRGLHGVRVDLGGRLVLEDAWLEP